MKERFAEVPYCLLQPFNVAAVDPPTERSLEVPVLIAVQGGGNGCNLAAIASPGTGETRLAKQRPIRVARGADRDPPHDHGLGGLCVDVEQ